jgi:hypothetical protein
MTRTLHAYTPLGGPTAPGPETAPCGRRASLWAFCLLLGGLFAVAYWPGSPAHHAPNIMALMHFGRGKAESGGARPAAPAAARPAAPAAARAAEPAAAPRQQPARQQPAPQPAPQQPQKKRDNTVLLELFVMSKCPDANFCEHAFARLLATLHPIVTVRTQ